MFRKTFATQYKLYKKGLKSWQTVLPEKKDISVNYMQLLRKIGISGDSNDNKIAKNPSSNSFVNRSIELSVEGNKRLRTCFSKFTQRHVLLSSAAVVAVQTGAEKVDPRAPTLFTEPLPEPPAIPEVITDVLPQLNALGEPTLASLGLGGWTPVGMVQQCLEFVHVTMGIPWWGAIVIGTIVVRTLMFPLVIISQRNAARMNNHMPRMQELQMLMTEARQYGNQMEAARYSQEIVTFMKEKKLNPMKNMIVPLAQMPLFVSFFMGLRKMANAPVESMMNGGMFWFTDLTVPDQYMILPLITSATLFLTIELGADTSKLTSQNMLYIKYIFRAVPLVVLPFIINFPGAILCYWCSSNFFSLVQVGFLRIPTIRNYFNIDQLITHDPKKLPVQSKGFVGGIKDSWNNLKLSKEIEERKRYDEVQFQRAGKGPVEKTYTFDPTKQVNNLHAISAKKR